MKLSAREVPAEEVGNGDEDLRSSSSVVVKDLKLKDKSKDLKIGPRGQGLSSRTTTLL